MRTEIIRPAEYAEKTLLEDILTGQLQPGAFLPAERELSERLGVARPALREALQRLARDGWLNIQHGKPTRINDYWRDGGLNVLSSLVKHSAELPPGFIPNLLDVRLALAPSYTHAAVQNAADQVAGILAGAPHLDAGAGQFASFDWILHYTLTVASGNPIYTLILNGFAGFYEAMAARYFSTPLTRQASHEFYARLLHAAQSQDAQSAEHVCRQAMQQALTLWRESLSSNKEE